MNCNLNPKLWPITSDAFYLPTYINLAILFSVIVLCSVVSLYLQLGFLAHEAHFLHISCSRPYFTSWRLYNGIWRNLISWDGSWFLWSVYQSIIHLYCIFVQAILSLQSILGSFEMQRLELFLSYTIHNMATHTKVKVKRPSSSCLLTFKISKKGKNRKPMLSIIDVIQLKTLLYILSQIL